MKKPKIRELIEAAKSLFSKPYTTKFPYGPPIPVPRGFRGRPKYDEKECVGCGACAQVCPVPDIYVEDITNETPPKRRLTIHLDECIFCGQCERYCITGKGIKLTEEYDLATYDRDSLRETVEKKLALCELCGSVIGPVDHIRWIAERVGESAFTNPTLMLTLLQTKEIPPKAPFSRRPDRIRILCHKCRKVTTLEL